MSRTQNETYNNSASHSNYDSKNASCIRFDWIYTNWYEILVIRISSDSIANKAIRI